MKKDKSCDFRNQYFYIGIDVHKKNWRICLRKSGMELKSFTIPPIPEKLVAFMQSHYPNGSYHSVYEAGFCGFWVHRRLTELGFMNRVIHPADVPTTAKEKDQKSDQIDARKLARELENGSLKSIYVPDEAHQGLRSLVRLRERQCRHQTRLKNRIKSFLAFHGVAIESDMDKRYWSNHFIHWLHEVALPTPVARDCLDSLLEELHLQRTHLTKTLKQMRFYSKQNEYKQVIHELLTSIPGIGFISAMTFYSEIIDMRRFPNADALNSFIGLVPSTSASGERHSDRGLSRRCNAALRYMIVEAAWKAIRIDPALTETFDRLTQGMSKQKAIIRIARKLVNRMRYVWLNQQTYQTGVLQ